MTIRMAEGGNAAIRPGYLGDQQGGDGTTGYGYGVGVDRQGKAEQSRAGQDCR